MRASNLGGASRRGGLLVAVVACALGGSASCATSGAAPAPEPQVEVPPSGDELFTAGNYAEAIVAYGRELEGMAEADERARVRLFRALARLAEGDARGEQDAMAELRAVELRYGTSLWGRIARIYILEITRRDALREAIMQAGAELRETEQHVQQLQHRLLTVQTLADDQERAIGSLKDERKKLQRQLEGVTEQAQAQSERILELQQELEALKQIDMRRKP